STAHPVTADLDRIALVLPASFTGFSAEVAEAHRSHLERLRSLVATEDIDGIVDLMLSRQPAEAAPMPPARSWRGSNAEHLVRTDMPDGLGLAVESAVDDTSGPAETLRDFAGEVLVPTHEDDPAHPVEVAEAIHAVTPGSDLEVLPAGSILWRGRQEVRGILGEFFG